jgi:hypothetical protein
MKQKKINYSLGCLLSITHLEKSPIRGSLFDQKLLNFSPTLMMGVKILERYKLTTIMTLLTVFRLSLKITQEKINLEENQDILLLHGTKNQLKAITRLLNLLKTDCKRLNYSISALIKAGIMTILISFKKRKRLKYLAIQNTNCLTEVIKFFFFYKYLKYAYRSKNQKYGIVANDHSAEPLAFTKFLKENNIKVTYLQHGHVSNFFPPLYRYDLAILYGEKSKEVYNRLGQPSDEIKFSGYQYQNATKMKPVKDNISVGIFPNIINENKLSFLLRKLNQNPVIDKIFIKPHPAHEVSKRFVEKISNHKKFQVLQAGDPFQDNIDLGIAGNSSIHIELLAIGIPTLYYDYLDDIEFDYYGFVRDDVVIHIPNLAVLKASTINKFYKNEKLQEAVSLFDYSFKSKEILNSELNSIKGYFDLS